MKRLSVILVSFLLYLPLSAQFKGTVYVDTDQSGLFNKGDKPLAGVMVTDGLNVVKTDKKGRFSLPGFDKTRFISITTPAGFENSFSGNLDPLIKIPGIVTIKAYCNDLSGSLPVIPLDGSNKPTTWKNLMEFMVYDNGFNGSIPYGYGIVIEKSGSKGIFRVNDNQLSGQIPSDIKAWSQYATQKKDWILKGNNLTE